MMWSFLAARYPERARAYAAWDHVLFEGAANPPTRITAYEGGLGALLKNSGFETWMWFHAATGRRVRFCYERRGLSLVREIQRLLPVSAGWSMEDAELLPILDSICPGFTRWAADMRLAE
jgi:hypothetical protein